MLNLSFGSYEGLINGYSISIDDIAKGSSLSSKTVKKRLEIMSEGHKVEFSILTNLSFTQLTGYVEFAALISIDMHYYQRIVEKIHEEWTNIYSTLQMVIHAAKIAG